MGRKFEIPAFYRSSVASTIKFARGLADHRKRDLAPTVLDLGPLRFKLARHFGFCFGVENAIEIAYRALKDNPDRRVFLLSEMIHHPLVNQDLVNRGVKFLLSPSGEQLIPFEELTPDDVVIIPAFGTTVQLFDRLAAIGINPQLYNATCPFVEKVWKRAEQLGQRGYTVIIHGKHYHEETRATFSHAALAAPSLVIRDIREAHILASILKAERALSDFEGFFGGRYSEGFRPEVHLAKIGVVNQTTMLAEETQAIADLLRAAIRERYGDQKIAEHFADTRDTLCYATSENQDAVRGLIAAGGDLALVVGGYNSSNTSHLVELCEQAVPTFYIKDDGEVVDGESIRHLTLHDNTLVTTHGWLPSHKPTIDILITAGASCPDALVDRVLLRVGSLLRVEHKIVGALEEAVEPILRDFPSTKVPQFLN